MLREGDAGWGDGVAMCGVFFVGFGVLMMKKTRGFSSMNGGGGGGAYELKKGGITPK